MESLKERVKNEEIVIQQTDKSGRNTVDSTANYKTSVQPHITNDTPITEEEYKELEKETSNLEVDQHEKEKREKREENEKKREKRREEKREKREERREKRTSNHEWTTGKEKVVS